MTKKMGVITEKICEEIPKKNGSRDPMFVGLDPSFNEFGVVILDLKANIVEQRLITSDTKLEADERIIQLEKEFKFIPTICGLHSVYIEGPSFSSSGKFVLQMGALHYYIRIFLLKKSTNFRIIAPGTLKKFVTGTGKGKKELMLLKVYKKWNVEFDNNNLCDAYSLARMALEDFKREKNEVV
jgi:crossover junction endodeoxyribonuclease RuvC